MKNKNTLDDIKDKISKEVQDGIELTCAAFAEIGAHQSTSHKLHSPQALRNSINHKVHQDLQVIQKHLNFGIKRLIEGARDLKLWNDQIRDDLLSFVKKICDLQTHAEELKEFFTKDVSLQEIFKINEDTIESFYQVAKHYYELPHYHEASACFNVLSILDSKRSVFWIGLGNSEFFCKNYQQALTAYAIAISCNPYDPTGHIYSAQCYELIKDFPHAINACDLALFVMEKNPSHRDLMQEVTEWKSRLVIQESSQSSL